ncbi:hypothetical protein TSUD_330620 [Trifolium subterraneum]|jgi:hypothetical protein|nr:hypothetical protein TSUD_330620 [Trifolium subterraneum]
MFIISENGSNKIATQTITGFNITELKLKYGGILVHPLDNFQLSSYLAVGFQKYANHIDVKSA